MAHALRRARRDEEAFPDAHMGSRYVHDPEYGGKVSLSGWREAKLGSEAGAPPQPSMPPDHPRVRELIGAHAAAG